MKHAIKKPGFTLVELLVVVAIMGMLFGLVVISNRPSRKTQLRQAAQSVASLVIATQSNALESEVGSAMWIADDGIYDANPQQKPWFNLTAVSSNPTTAVTLVGGTVDPHACRVRFVSTANSAQPPSPWFDIDGQTAKFFSPAQTPYNTVWPARFYTYPSDPQTRAEFDLTPVKTGLAYQWPKLAKIDWRYSGIGNTAPLPAEVAARFDASGKIDAFFTDMSGGKVFDTATSTLYLCIAYAPDVDQGNATLDSDDTVWVAIEPGAVRVSLGWNNRQQNIETNYSAIENLTGQNLLSFQEDLQSARANVIAGKGLAD